MWDLACPFRVARPVFCASVKTGYVVVIPRSCGFCVRMCVLGQAFAPPSAYNLLHVPDGSSFLPPWVIRRRSEKPREPFDSRVVLAEALGEGSGIIRFIPSWFFVGVLRRPLAVSASPQLLFGVVFKHPHQQRFWVCDCPLRPSPRLGTVRHGVHPCSRELRLRE